MRCKAKTKAGKRCKNDAVDDTGYCHIPAHRAQGMEDKSEAEQELNPKQIKFCKLFVSEEFYGNGVQSYIEAYNIDLTNKGAYRGARASASRLLTDANICLYIDELLEDAGLNDQFVDKQLLHLIRQHADYSNKMRAIEQYNKVKGRITQHIDVKSGEEPIKGIVFKITEGNDPSELYGDQE